MSLWFRISKKSSIGRKSIALARKFPRHLKRIASRADDFALAPPAMANSFPKSGTHLLVQLLEAFPGTTNYGTFIASMPSVTYRERPPEIHRKMISYIVPGEVVTAHMFYHSSFPSEMKKRKCAHFFIYRDPRDVVVSEAHYLTFMNRWHRLHSYFKTLPTNNERIMLCIKGACDRNLPFNYPNIEQRFRQYEGWLLQEDVFCIKFEDLISENRENIISEMVKFYQLHAKNALNRDKIVEKALQNINPKKSHTFRQGKSGGWREVFTKNHKEEFKYLGGDMLIRLGYEKDNDW